MPKIQKQTHSGKPATKPRTAVKPKTGSVIDRIGPIDFSNANGITLSLYGNSGTGKTRLWSTFPGPILAVICNGINTPGELRSIDTPANRKKIHQVSLNSSNELYELTDYAKTGGFATVVIDYAGAYQDMILCEIMGWDQMPAQKSWRMAERDQFGECASKTKEGLRALLNLGGMCNVVVVAQERAFNVDEGASDVIKPYVTSALMPSVTAWLNPACDYVAQTYKRHRMVPGEKTKIGDDWIEGDPVADGIEFCLRVGPDATYATKFRLPEGCTLPDAIVDPTYDKVMAVIESAYR